MLNLILDLEENMGGDPETLQEGENYLVLYRDVSDGDILTTVAPCEEGTFDFRDQDFVTKRIQPSFEASVSRHLILGWCRLPYVIEKGRNKELM